MGNLNVAVSFDLRAFTGRRSSERFIRENGEDILEAVRFGLDNRNFAVGGADIIDTNYEPDEGEVERYETRPASISHGLGNSFVFDNERKEYIFGPENEFKCNKVRDTLNDIEQGLNTNA